jgi:serine/threonine-protein kinase
MGERANVTKRINQILSDRYELQDVLGTGGMAEVYLGRDRVLGRTVAVKTLLPQYAGDDHFIERFRREAQHAAALNHPNVVSVYDTGDDQNVNYIVMEYVEGKTLRDIIRDEGPLLSDRVAEIAADVCAGLSFAHAHDIIHRDVKPANIMITSSGGVKVADFGIARAATGDSVTQTAMVLGTAQYFSPEQAQSNPVDARSDLYSLGVVMYEMLTRQVPFTGSSPVAIAYKHVKEDPVLPSRINEDVPPDIEAVVMKAMSKNPDNRYQSAQEMREDLQRAMHGRPVEATPVLADATGVISPLADDTVLLERARTTSTRPPPTEEEKRRRTGIILLSVIIVAILGVAAWALAGILGSPRQVRVPDVLGERVSLAQQRLEDAGFQVRIARAIFSDRYDPDTVARQDPEEGTRLEAGSTVTITPSLGTELILVPDLTGMTEGQAREELKEAGLEMGVVSFQTSSTVSAGRIIDQEPSADSRVTKERKVDVTISSGPPTETVPDVVDRLEDDARSILEGRGFEVLRIYEEQNPDCLVEAGRVCRQEPKGNTEAQAGSTVTIYVAKEAEEPEPEPQCSDGIDNDGDGFTDWPDDPECTDPTDEDESA